MTKREIIEIDDEKCNGCGECIPNCAEGALQIVDGKVQIVSDALCDGLGACLGHCPQGALRIIQREAAPFDEEAVEAHLAQLKQEAASCADCQPEARRQWPIALRLVPIAAPFFQNADLLIAADCVPFAYRNFHDEFLKGKTLVFGCPKFDNAQGYQTKLTEIFRQNSIQSITLLLMEVPCCSGLGNIVKTALANSGKDIPLKKTIITVDGQHKQ
jgi:Fe-S-cluster-containing hydrogenase component 2